MHETLRETRSPTASSSAWLRSILPKAPSLQTPYPRMRQKGRTSLRKRPFLVRARTKCARYFPGNRVPENRSWHSTERSSPDPEFRPQKMEQKPATREARSATLLWVGRGGDEDAY